MTQNKISVSTQNESRLHVPLPRRVLAMHYFPSPTPESSVRKLSRWLESDPSLLHDLEAVGYRSGQRLFTRKELEVFIRYFGD